MNQSMKISISLERERVVNPPSAVYKPIDLVKHMKMTGRAAHGRRCAADKSLDARTREPERNCNPRAEDFRKRRRNRPLPVARPRARRASPSGNQLHVMVSNGSVDHVLVVLFSLTRVSSRKGKGSWVETKRGMAPSKMATEMCRTMQINIDCGGDARGAEGDPHVVMM